METEILLAQFKFLISQVNWVRILFFSKNLNHFYLYISLLNEFNSEILVFIIDSFCKVK
jgi:hypothetical protein